MLEQLSAASKYIDCELRVLSDKEANLKVVDPVSSARPFVECTGATKLREISHCALESLAPEAYGQQLFDAVLCDKLFASFYSALAVAQREQKTLRFRLVLPSRRHKKLHRLNWELLYDSGLALGCSPTTPFSRYVATGSAPGWPVTDKPRLLVVTSSPSDVTGFGLSPLDRCELQATIEKALGTSRLEFDFLEGAATRRRISERLFDGNYHALHLQAHGLKTSKLRSPRLMLEKKDRTCDLVSANDFAKICMGSRSLRLAVLIACHSGVVPESDPLCGLGPKLMQGGIPAVVAMRYSISIEAAARFTRRFYQRLAVTGTIDVAVNEARRHLSLDDSGNRDWATPVLYMRLQRGQMWHSRIRLKSIPELLPYTVDRGAQERGFRRAVNTQQQRPTRPLVCLISGDDRQALDMFEERIEKEFLPDTLDSRAGVSGYRLHCPPENSSRLNERFRRELSLKFLNRPDGSLDEINFAFSQINRPVLIHLHLVSEECRKPQAWLAAFLDFWADWPDLSRCQNLYVLLFVEYEHEHAGAKNLFSLVRSQRRERRLRKFERVFASYEADYPTRLTSATLPRLVNIRRGAVNHWACGDELRKYCKQQALLGEVKILFRDWKAKMSMTAIPMEDLAKRLEMILMQNLDVGRSK